MRDLLHAPATAKHRRMVAAEQLGLLLADIFSFVMFLPLLVTVYRLSGLLKCLREISQRPARGIREAPVAASDTVSGFGDQPVSCRCLVTIRFTYRTVNVGSFRVIGELKEPLQVACGDAVPVSLLARTSCEN